MLKTLLLFLSIVLLCQQLLLAHAVDASPVPPGNSTQSRLVSIQFESQFTRIGSQVDYVSRTLDLNNTEKFKFIIQKCKEITSGLNVLHRSLTKFKLFIIPQRKMCPGVSTFNRSEINRYVTYTQGKEKEISQYYSTCTGCQFIIPDIVKMIDMTNNYFSFINSTLNGDFCPKNLNEKATGMVDISKSYFKNNLAADNWFYGTITKSDYKIIMFKRSATYNLTSCPIDKPFAKFVEQVCIRCPEGSIYNLGTQNCTSCGINEAYNVDTGKCDGCLGNKEVRNNMVVCKTCQASNHQSYNNLTGRCQVCTGNNYFDPSDNGCKQISCSINTPKFNYATLQCEACGVNEEGDPKDPTKCVQTNYIGVCPKSNPQFDKTTQTCRACAIGTSYNSSTYKCQATSPSS